MKLLFQLSAFIFCFIQLSLANEEYQTKAEAKHNEFRKKHKVSDLKLDNKLNELAIKCAKYYAKKGAIDHSCPDKGKAGENLFMGQGGSSDPEWAEQATQMWYDEVKDYDFPKGQFSAATGHFTQLVWKGSQKLGIGIGKEGQNVIVVALYDPAGNMMGDFVKNVIKA